MKAISQGNKLWLFSFLNGRDLQSERCISNCSDKHNTWLLKSFIMQGHNDHKGGTMTACAKAI